MRKRKAGKATAAIISQAMTALANGRWNKATKADRRRQGEALARGRREAAERRKAEVEAKAKAAE
jgi:hypothetical protein